MHGIWEFLLRKATFTKLLIAACVVLGTIAVVSITKESAPEVQIPVGIVSTALPGASPAEVERLITNKIEEKLTNLADLNKLTSSSREGVSVVTAEFNASADIDKSIQKLKDEVDKAKPELPDDATDPVVTDVNFVDQPVQIISISASAPFGELAELAETLKSDLQSLRGVSRVEVSGVREREIQVVVRKEDLLRYGLSLPQVVSAIASANATLPVGSIVNDGIAYNVAFEGSLDDIERFDLLPILSFSGQPLYLRDIATVSDGVEENRSLTRVSREGTPSEQAFSLAVFKVRGYDVTTMTSAVRERLSELQQNENLLAASEVIIVQDAGEEVQKDLTQLVTTGMETVALVVLTLLITIGWREAIVAALSIPLSFLIAFIGLLYSGNTINFVSLFSLILAIGILVDSGIVVVEAIHTRLKSHGALGSAIEALREYAWPLIGGTMTTVAVFVPLFFISGIVGKFIASIPFTLIFVLLASIVVALGFVPLLTILMLGNGQKEHSRLQALQEHIAQSAQSWYRRFLTDFLKARHDQNRFLAFMAIGFFVALSLPMIGAIKVDFFPQGDIDFLYVDVEMPQGTTVVQTDLIMRAIEERLYPIEEIESFVTSVGGTSSFSNSPQSGGRYGTITIKLPREREFTSSTVVSRIQKEVLPLTARADIRVGQPSGGPPVGAEILIKFKGKDADALDQAVLIARDVLATVPGTTNVDTSNKDSGVEYVLEIDRAKLAAAGITPAQLASTLRTALSGSTATKLTGGTKDVDVVVSLNLNERFSDPHDTNEITIDALRQLSIPTPQGETVILGSLLNESVRKTNATIVHEGRERLMSVTASLLPTATAQEVVATFTEKMVDVTLPSGVTMEIGGENEETNQSFKEMGYAFLAGIALMFVVLVLSFDSFRLSGYILLSIPLSLIGVFAGLALTGQALSFPSLLGVIALSGVIVNNGIILIDVMISRVAAARKNAESYLESIVESAVLRLRPILLTTITTVIGMIPLTHASDLWAPLAYAILFGLMFATLLTLVLIPMLVYRWPGKLMRELIAETQENC